MRGSRTRFGSKARSCEPKDLIIESGQAGSVQIRQWDGSDSGHTMDSLTLTSGSSNISPNLVYCSNVAKAETYTGEDLGLTK
jgi:hypothetical protein